MSQKTKNIVLGSVLFLVLSLFNIHFFALNKSFAAGINNVVLTLLDSAPSSSGAVMLSFEVDDAIPANGKIQIEFPADFSNLETASSTGTNLGLNPSFGTGETLSTLEITLGTGGASTGSAITASGFTLTNPNEDGFYLVQLRTYDQNDLLLAMGFKLVEVGSAIDIKSKVEESLVVSLDAGTKVFLPDPAINNGQITDQVTTMTVQTNANTSYLVTGELTGNELTSGSGTAISSNSGADDYFRIGKIELNLESGTGTSVSDGTVFTGSTSLFSKSTGISTNGDLISVHYDLNVSYYKAIGTYTGGVVYSVYPTF